MKVVITTLALALITISLLGQKVIYVTDATDKRLIAYRDSLKKWHENEKQKVRDTVELQSAQTLGEYNAIVAKLGYTGVVKNATHLPNGKIIDYDPLPTLLEYLTCFHSRGGDIRHTYRGVVQKPAVRVIHKKPTRYRITTRINIDIDKNITIDSIKTIIQ